MSIDTFLLSSDTTDLNYPEVRPTLDLNFARVKALDPRITFTRASGGSYVGADGLIKYAGVNEPRFDHDPVTGESLGFLVEGSRTNLTLYSGDFSQAHWSKISLSIFTANTIIAPDGTLTGSFIAFQNASSYLTSAQGLQPNTSISAGTNTLSCFAKIGTARYLALGLSNNGGEMSTAIFDLQTGTVKGANSHPSFTVNGTSISNAGAGWYRCSLTSTYAAGMAAHISSSTSGLLGAYYEFTVSGDGTSGIYVWGAQLETGIPAGSVTLLGLGPTSYIPTEGSTRTRAADNATITGTNFSSWYNTIKGGGTIFTRYADNLVKNTNPGHTFSFNGGGVRWLSNWGSYQVYDGIVSIGGAPPNNRTSPVSEAGALEVTADGIARQSVARNGIVFVQNGGKVRITGMTQLSIGYSSNTLQYLTGTFSRLTYWPKKLTDAQLQVLTR